MKNTPARRSSITVFKGRVFHVDRDLVALPDGRTVPLDVVRHRGSVVLVPQPDRQHVILIRQYRYAIRKWIWELPAGSLDAKESAAHAATRECEEEIGWTPRKLTKLSEWFPTPGFCDEKMTFFRCEKLTTPKGPIARDADEQIEPRTFTIEAAWRLVESGQVVDMKTVLGLVLIQRADRRVSGRSARASRAR